MRVKITTQHLRDSLNKVLSVVDKKSSRPILTYTLISTDKNALNFSATDLEVSAKVSVEANVEIEGKFCVNAKNISDIGKVMAIVMKKGSGKVDGGIANRIAKELLQ